MARRNEEWLGKTDDTRVPDRVKLRIFDKYKGRCYISGIKIRPGMRWEVEHIIALSLGGGNCESNLAPVLPETHKEKTKTDRKAKAKSDRIRKKHLGIWKPKKPQSKYKRTVNRGTILRGGPEDT